MEFCDLGKHCKFCFRQDYLPFQCKYCREFYCLEHRMMDDHQCIKKKYKKKCPICQSKNHNKDSPHLCSINIEET